MLTFLCYLSKRGDRSPNSCLSQPADRGFTLMEGIVAILVVAIMTAMIAPALLISSATRSQNARVEQAMFLAQREIDRYRVLVERGGYTNDELPPTTTTADLTDTPAPACDVASGKVTGCKTGDIVNEVKYIDGKGYVIQVVRSSTGTTFDDILISFDVLVRVYSDRGFIDGLPAQTDATLDRTIISGKESNLPLVIQSTQITRGDIPSTLCNISDCGAEEEEEED